MGLFRLAIVAAIGVSLLPSDTEQQERLYTRAAEAAHWTITFCSRNEVTCTQAASLWGQFVKKAQFGAKLAYDAMVRKECTVRHRHRHRDGRPRSAAAAAKGAAADTETL